MTARHESVRVPASKVKRAIADVLQSEGFIAGYKEEEEGSRRYLRLSINYLNDRQAAIGGSGAFRGPASASTSTSARSRVSTAGWGSRS